MPDRLIGLPVYIDPNESLLYTTMPEASSESAFELENCSIIQNSSFPLSKTASPCELKRTPTLRRQIIAPPPMPPIYLIASPIMTRRNPRIPPAMPSNFVPTILHSNIPSRQSPYHHSPTLLPNRKERNNRKKSPGHRHRHKSNKNSDNLHKEQRNSIPNDKNQIIQVPIYSRQPVRTAPANPNNRLTLCSNRSYDNDDEPYEVMPLIYTDLNQSHIAEPIQDPQFNRICSRLFLMNGQKPPFYLNQMPPSRQVTSANGNYNNYAQSAFLPPRNNLNQLPYIQQKNACQNPTINPIYQSQPQIYSSAIYATQNQVYSNLMQSKPQVNLKSNPPPIYSNLGSSPRDVNTNETEYLGNNKNFQRQSNVIDSYVDMNTNTTSPIFGGLSKRLRNVFHGFRI